MTQELAPDLAEILAPSRTTLVVWDMQIGIASRAVNLSTLRETIPDLIASARRAGVRVVWSRHVVPDAANLAPGTIRAMMRRQGVTRRSDLVVGMLDGSPEGAYIEGFTPDPGDLVIVKHTPSFFIGTPFQSRLSALGVQTIVICGVATELGVEHTARHAAALGYVPVVAEDGVSSFSAEGHELGMRFLRSNVDVAPSGTIVAAWDSTN